jgi:hypothetical protein
MFSICIFYNFTCKVVSARASHYCMLHCNVPNSASLGNTAKLSNPLFDLILWGFLDAFELMF